ncbi:MAG: M48 family metallopeptidase, partial [Methanosarcinales archaeon]
GFIVAFFSAYLLTPLSLRWLKQFENAPMHILNSLEELSKKAGLKKAPKLMLAETSEINAMAYTSLFGKRVVLTRGLLEAYQSGKLEHEEFKAILGHELGHHKNLDCLKRKIALAWISIFDAIGTLTMRIGEVLANLGVILSEATEETVITKEGRGRYVARRKWGWLGLFIVIFGWMCYLTGVLQKFIAKIASILAFHLSRKQEYECDLVGAELTSPEVMRSALHKIEKLNKELIVKELVELPYADRWQIQPRNPSWIDRLFDTHPPNEKRVSALRRISEFL